MMGRAFDDIAPVLTGLGAAGHRNVDLVAVGRLAAMSPGHAQRTFLAVVGASPKRYQLGRRLAHAAAVLASTDLPVGDVATRVGFRSHEAFTRAFHRAYGCSPTDYRTRVTTGSTRSIPDGHVATIDRVAACVSLYRTPVARPRATTTLRGGAMSYDITTETLAETPIVYLRRRADVDDVAATLAEALPAVFGFVMAQGWAMAGPPLVRYVDHSPAFVTLEAGLPLVEPAPTPVGHDEIEAGVLPAGPALTTVHTGPYEGLGEAHAALDRWMVTNDLQPGGPPWEVYLTDPGEVPDPADWKTQLYWPVAAS